MMSTKLEDGYFPQAGDYFDIPSTNNCNGPDIDDAVVDAYKMFAQMAPFDGQRIVECKALIIQRLADLAAIVSGPNCYHGANEQQVYAYAFDERLSLLGFLENITVCLVREGLV